jgi:hypothetical protein
MKPRSSMPASRARRESLLAWLLVSAFLVRALIPQGFMPAAAGESLLVLCTAQGAVAVRATEAPLPQPAHARAECPFAFALGMAAAPIATQGIELPAPAALSNNSLPVTPAVAGAPSHYSARGPPLLV